MDFVPAKKSSGSQSTRQVVNSNRTTVSDATKTRISTTVSTSGAKITSSKTSSRTKTHQKTFYRAMPDKPSNQSKDDGLGVVTTLDTGTAQKENTPPTQQNIAQKKTYQVPKSPFINQAKVAKRPLSKNVYQKKIEPTVDTTESPITIISKPEKDSKAGLIIGIILTIILGAAAGTIAFLLLPK